MHSIFSPSEHGLFSESLETQAANLCGANVTLTEVTTFSRDLAQAFGKSKPQSEFRVNLPKLVMPVAYAILDPAELPTVGGELDDSTKRIVQRGWVMITWLAVDLIAGTPKEAAVQLWPRIWAYFQLVEKHRSELDLNQLVPSLPEPYLLVADSAPGPTISRVFLFVVAQLEMVSHLRNLILATPGALRLLVRAWPHMHDLEPSGVRAAISAGVCNVLADRSVSEPRRKAEYIDGAGGIEELARLMILQADAGVRDMKAGETASGGILFSQAVFILMALEPPAQRLLKLTPLATPLVSQGLVRALAEGLALLVSSSDKSIVAILPHVWHVIRCFMRLPPGNLRLAEAVQHKLPQTILRLAANGLAPRSEDQLEQFVHEIFPVGLVRVDVLAAFKNQILELEALAATKSFRASSLFAKWEKFVPRLQHCLRVLANVESGVFMPRKMCDNLKCGRVASETEFKRCSRCQSIFYCSQECQATDWRTGGHKKACADFRMAYLHESELDLAPNDKDFIRALMDTDLKVHWNDNFLAFANFSNTHPEEELVRIFDYSAEARATTNFLSMRPVSDFKPADVELAFGAGESGKRIWAEHVRRAKSSTGRVELDFARFSSGWETKMWFVSRRVQNSTVPGMRAMRADVSRRFRSGDPEFWANPAGLLPGYMATMPTLQDEVGFH